MSLSSWFKRSRAERAKSVGKWSEHVAAGFGIWSLFDPHTALVAHEALSTFCAVIVNGGTP